MVRSTCGTRKTVSEQTLFKKMVACFVSFAMILLLMPPVALRAFADPTDDTAVEVTFVAQATSGDLSDIRSSETSGVYFKGEVKITATALVPQGDADSFDTATLELDTDGTYEKVDDSQDAAAKWEKGTEDSGKVPFTLDVTFGEGSDHYLKVTAGKTETEPGTEFIYKDEVQTEAEKFVVDTTDPQVSVSVDGTESSTANGVTYYESGAKLKVSVVETNFNAATTQVFANAADDEPLEIEASAWQDGTEENEHVVTVAMEANTKYVKPKAKAVDYAGREGNGSLDKTVALMPDAASVTMAVKGTRVGSDAVEGYDRFSKFDQMTITATDVNGVGDVKVDGTTAKTESDWTHSDGVYTCTINSLADGDHAITADVTDKTDTSVTFTYGSNAKIQLEDGTTLTGTQGLSIDTAKPIVAVAAAADTSVKKTTVGSGSDVVTWYNGAVVAVVTVEDLHIDPTADESSVVVTGVNNAAAGAWEAKGVNAGTGAKKYSRTYTFNAGTDLELAATQVAVKAKDEFGQESDEMKSAKFGIDTKAPVLSASDEDGEGKIYAGRGGLKVTATDLLFDPDATTMTVSDKDGAVLVSRTGEGAAESDDKIVTIGAWVDKGNGQWECTIDFASGEDADGTYKLHVTEAADKVGNAVLAKDLITREQIVIDHTPPVVTVAFPGQQVSETIAGTVYSIFQSLTGDESGKDHIELRVAEESFDANRVASLIWYDKDGAVLLKQDDVTGWTEDEASDPNSDPVWTLSVDYPGESEEEQLEYRNVEVTVADKAGNATTVVYENGDVVDPNDPNSVIGRIINQNEETIGGDKGKFVLDKKKPEVSIEMSQGPVTFETANDGKKTDYYKDKVAATVTIEEEFFNLANTTVLVNGNSRSLTWREDGTKHIATIDFNDSEANTISVRSTDWAGNESETVTYADATFNGKKVGGSAFSVDAKAPVIQSVTFDQVLTAAANSGSNFTKTDYFGAVTVARVTVSDEHFDAANSKVAANGGSVGEWKRNGSSNEYTLDVTFNEGQGKTISVTVADLVGHEAGTATGSNVGNIIQDKAGAPLLGSDFAVDASAPKISSVVFEEPRARAVDMVDYFNSMSNGALKVTVTVRDANFDSKNSTAVQNGSAKSGWTQSKSDSAVWTLNLEYAEGTGHTLALNLVDLSGNKTAWSYGNSKDEAGTACTVQDSAGNALAGAPKFSVDTTDPSISIAMAQKVARADAERNTDFFNTANSDGKLVATVTVKDVNFLNTENGYTFTTDGTVVSDNGVVWKRDDVAEGKRATWTAKVNFAQGKNHTLTVKITDKAKNSSSYAYGSGSRTTDKANTELGNSKFTLDISAPTVPTAKTSTKKSGNYDDKYLFHKDKTKLTVRVRDNIGIMSLQLDSKDFTIGNIESFKAGAKKFNASIALADGKAFNRSVVLTATDLAQNKRTWNISANGQVTEQRTEAKIKNISLNKEEIYPKAVLQDTVSPKLTVTGATAGTYYAAGRTVKMTIDELNFGYVQQYAPDQIIATITSRAGSAGASAKKSTVTAADFKQGKDGLYEYSAQFSSDGHYSVDAQVTDPAGNKDKASIGTFTVDRTRPTVSVTFDNNSSQNGKYYSAGRTATVTVTEHNFSGGKFNISSSGSVGAWSSSGDTHTARVSFGSDGTYNLRVTGSDAAGNTLAQYDSGEFVVDQSAPEIKFSQVEDEGAYNGEVTPVINFIDEANFDSNGTSYTLTGNKLGEVDYAASTSNTSAGADVTFADFEREADVDDIYTIDASMTDLAGNSAQGTITFSVNRFGSNFRVVDEDEFQNGYINKARNVKVEEVNVSGVARKEHYVSMTRGVETTTLERTRSEQPTGYTLSSSDDDNGWAVYEYDVAAGNFDQNGEYKVDVLSSDAAGNDNHLSSYYDHEEQKSKQDATVSFFLDTEQPEVLGLNIETNGVYEAPVYAVTYNVTDNVKLKSTAAYLDGQPVSATETEPGRYEIPVAAQAFTPHSLRIEAVDYANEPKYEQVDNFRVTTSFIELHMLLFAGLVVLAAAAAGGGVFYGLKRRNAKADASQSNTGTPAAQG